MPPATTEGQLNRHLSQLLAVILTSIRCVSVIGNHLVRLAPGGALFTCVLLLVAIHDYLQRPMREIMIPLRQLVRMMNKQTHHARYPI